MSLCKYYSGAVLIAVVDAPSSLCQVSIIVQKNGLLPLLDHRTNTGTTDINTIIRQHINSYTTVHRTLVLYHYTYVLVSIIV